jgi:hypothetical protein
LPVNIDLRGWRKALGEIGGRLYLYLALVAPGTQDLSYCDIFRFSCAHTYFCNWS